MKFNYLMKFMVNNLLSIEVKEKLNNKAAEKDGYDWITDSGKIQLRDGRTGMPWKGQLLWEVCIC